MANDMSLEQALSLATLLIDFELEQPQVKPPPLAWESELKAAKRTIAGAIARPRKDFFLSPPERRRAGRERGY